jgi:hypothetical protein
MDAMLYRKAPASPSRMLLRVAAVATTGALVGACSSSPPTCTGFCGGIVQSTVDAEAGPDAAPDADAALPCGTGVCGSIIMPTDAAYETSDN